jgi:hypothetical protein
MNPNRIDRPVTVLAVISFVALAFAPLSVQAHEGAKHTDPAPKTATTSKTSGGEAITAKVKTVTMQGEIVDPQCWIQHDGRGKAHAGCALACAKAGQTLAFLDDKTGTLYQLLAENHSSDPNEKWYGLVGKPVIVKGDVMSRGGMNAIVLRSAVVDREGKQRP